MRKLLTFIILSALMLPLFAAGSSEESSTIVIWHCNTGKAGSAFEEIIDDFNEGIGKEKGIEIEAIYQGKANDVLTKVKAAAESGTLPDIAQMDATAATDMNNADYLMTIDTLGLDTKAILPSALSAMRSEKGILGLPFNASSLLFYYNKTLFDSLTISPPKTLDEFASIAPMLGAKDGDTVTRYAFAGVPTTYELTTFLGAQNGLSYMVNNKNGHNGMATEVLFDKEGTYEAFLTKWKALYDTGYLGNITSGVSSEFAAGRTASMLASSSNLSTVIDSVGDAFEVGVAFVPMVNEEATGGTAVGGGGLYAFSDSDSVKIVLEYLLSPEVQFKWGKATGYIPVNVEVFESDEYAEFIKDNELFSVAIEQVMASNPDLTNVWLPSAYQIYYSFQANIQSVTANDLDITTAVNEMANIVQDALDTYAAQNSN